MSPSTSTTTETITRLIDHWAGTRGGDPFLIGADSASGMTFEELGNASRLVSAQLEQLGIDPGEKVGFLMDNGVWTAALFLAIMYSGRTVVPLNAVSGQSNIRYVLEHSDAQAVFVSKAHEDLLAESMKGLAHTPEVVPADPDNGPSWAGTAAAPAASPTVQPGDDALLIYTSGTTGRPKGVVHTQASTIAGARNTVIAHHLSQEDRALCVLPLYHINGEIVTVVAPLLSGGSVVMPRRFSAQRFWDLVEQHRCTWFSLVPTIIAYLLDDAADKAERVKTGNGFEQVRFGRSASSALAPATHRGFEQQFGISIIETMGLSETAAQILSNPLPPFQSKYGSPGIAYGNEVCIMDADGKTLPPGERGEVMIRGENVMKEYYKNPEATAAALTSDGWLHSGDLGYRDEDGFFFITGRIKELIIKGGENIAPREIDDVLYSHDAVLEAAAFAIPDDKYGEEVMACVVPKSDASIRPEDIRDYCVRELGRFKAPKEVVFVDELPKGPSGKVQRLKIAEMLGSQDPPAPTKPVASQG